MSNIKNKVFKGETLGVYFGTFAPFHLGHYQSVMKAKKENDACLVVVSGHDNDRGSDIGLGLEKRFRYTRELFADDENVLVEKYDESHIARYPDGWNDWFEGVLNLVQAHTQALPSVK
uniref:adenylyltransferase/cytidyltransferase family protein n=1 Tax=Jeotgalibaca porci TaxID=1868793 RepID=UPI0035A0789D